MGGRPAGNRKSVEPIIHSDSRWDALRKRALFTSDGPDSLTSGSDIPEGHTDRPPETESTEGLCSPTWELEVAVSRLQKELKDCFTDFEIAKKQTTAVTTRPQSRSGFTSTPVPRYSGKSNWEQCREVFEAIVCSNSWDFSSGRRCT